jgi:predicted nucleic acid-binding protein
MASSSFPDVNVWLALLLENHTSRAAARNWWESDQSEVIGFSRFTQIGVLRLLTTGAAMNGKPLTMNQAWKAYDRLFEDDRVFVG